MARDADSGSPSTAGDPDTSVELVVEPRVRPVGRGEVRRVLPHRARRMVGPFVFADLMGPDVLGRGEGMDVDAHPHIGLSTLTYLFTGTLVHRDSTGAHQRIEPGAVNWMTAGRGVCHTERSAPEDRAEEAVLSGLQTWVALPAEAEDGEPTFEHQPASAIPQEERPGVVLRVVAGRAWGLTSPVRVSSPLLLAEVVLLDGAELTIEAGLAERAVLNAGGFLSVGGRPLPEGALAVLAAGAEPVVAGDGRAMVLGGEPVGTRHIWWNFVASDPERIEAAKADWVAQRFPLVPGDHDPWVPLPAS